MDTASSHTVISKNIAKFLQAKIICKTNITIENMHGEEQYDAYKCEVVLPQNTKIEAYSIDNPMCPVETNKCLLKKAWPALDSEIMHDVIKNLYNGATDILVGIDNYWKFNLSNILTHPSHQFGIVKTKFGWTISGNLSASPNLIKSQPGYVRIINNMEKITEIETSLKELFNRDEELNQDSKYSYEEEYAVNLFNQTIRQQTDGRYIVNPLFRKEAVKLQNNYYLALIRYNSLMRTLRRHPERLKMYNEAMRAMLDKQEVEKVTEDPSISKSMSSILYYIPHSGVYKKERVTTSLRIVFDASAKNPQGVSLNDQLLEGPKLQLDIVELLIKLRLKRIVILGDLKRMFYNILIQEDCRDYFRFLWNFEDEERPNIFRFRTLIMGAKSSPYLAIATVHHHLRKVAMEQPQNEHICKMLLSSMYVDDVIGSADTVHEAISIRKFATEVFNQMCMKVRKWVTNSQQLLKTIPEDDRYPFEPIVKSGQDENLTFQEGSDNANVITKDTTCLGMSFNPRLDCLHYQTYGNLIQTKPPKETKRGISSIIPSLYDPCGLIMPFLAEGKSILQRTWCYRDKKGVSLDWDDNLPSDIKLDFAKWLDFIPQISTIRHPRYLFEELETPPERNSYTCTYFVMPVKTHLESRHI